jgi:tetratricopeptide (TPR) repeat protein
MRLPIRLIGAALAMLASASMVRAQSMSRVEVAMGRARTLLGSHSYREAESLYVMTLQWLPADATSQRAAAHFGRAFAAQQRLATGDTAGVVLLDTIVRSYYTSAELDAGQFRVASANNLALMYRERGDHRKALEQFTAAERASDGAAKTGYLISIAREYEDLGDLRGAARFYEQAVTRDSSSEAIRGLFRSYAGASPSIVLEATKKLRNDSANAGVVLEALVALLKRDSLTADRREATQALVYLAETLPVARVGPSAFDGALLDGLLAAKTRHRDIARGIDAVIYAYGPRDEQNVYRDAGAGSWWRSPDEARAVWSSLLRWLGDSYSEQDAKAVAASYYEAAIEGNGSGIFDPKADRRALTRLALIYAQSDKSKGDRLMRNVENFTELMFSAKAQAYGNNDLEQIRDLHTALGTFYAERGQWTGPDARNAEFQLSRMRLATAQLAQKGARVSDPPELLAKLATHYEATGEAAKARTVEKDLRAVYVTKGRPDRADSLLQRTRRARDTTAIIKAARPTPAAVLVAAKRMTGRIVDGSTGRPIPNASLAIVQNGQERVIAADTSGFFSFQVPAATVALEAEARAANYVSLAVTLKPDAEANVRLKRAAVLRPETKPAAEALILRPKP